MTTTKTYPMPDYDWLVQQLDSGLQLALRNIEGAFSGQPATLESVRELSHDFSKIVAQRIRERFFFWPEQDLLRRFIAFYLPARAEEIAGHLDANWVGHCEGKAWLESRGKSL